MRASLLLSFVLFSVRVIPQIPEAGMTSPPIEIREWIHQSRETGDIRRFELQRPIVLEFFATWCQPCRLSLPHLNELARDYGQLADFILISLEKETVLREYFREKPFYNVAVDLDGRTTFNYGITFIPYLFLIGPEGRVAWSGIPSDLHGEMIRMAAEGKPVSAINDFSRSSVPVDLNEMNRDLLRKYKIHPVYRLEIYESDPVEPLLVKDDNYLNIKAPLTEVIAYLCDIGSPARFSMDEFDHDPFIQMKFSSEYVGQDRMKEEVLEHLESAYGFHSLDKDMEMEVRSIHIVRESRLPGPDRILMLGVESRYTVDDDRSITGDNIDIGTLCHLLEMRYGTIFEDRSGDTVRRDWRIPFMDIDELDDYLRVNYGLSAVLSVSPVTIRRIELEGE